VFASLHRIYAGLDVRGTSIDAVLPLYVDELLPSVRVTRIRRGPARRACGADVVDRSWVALVNAPRARAATIGFRLVYVARTPRGWQPWYDWAPNYSGRGTLLPTR
jgi:hypothetical protein